MTATIRYNIVAVDGVDPGAFESQMKVRYEAIGLSQVLLELIEVNLTTGISTTRLVLDSNNLPAFGGLQTQVVVTCFFFFNFSDNAYYINAKLSTFKTTGRFVAVPFAGLQAIQVGPGSTQCVS